MSQDIVPFEQRFGALTTGDVRSQVNLIQQIMRDIMQGPTKENPAGVHYGVIPGTPKPTLLQPGAQKLCLTFRLNPQFDAVTERDGNHVTVTSKCNLIHIPSGESYGSGMGSCSTRESRYAYRQANRKCPNCGSEAIIKGKDFKGTGEPTGWLCFAKKGGCGARFKDGDQDIESQKIGRVPNEDLADQYNTVLKMANKRALVAAVLNTTAASDIFTQDIEDSPNPVRNIPKDDLEREIDEQNRVAGSEQPPALDAIPAQGKSPAAGGPPITRTDTLKDLCAKAGITLIDLLAKAKVKHADELSESDWAEALAMLKRRIEKRAAT